MKKIKYISLSFLILFTAYFIGCDDSGVIHGSGVKGTIILQPTNLPHLNETVDGYYELWLRLDSSGVGTYYTCGKFNMSYSGTVTDTAGGQMTFKFTGDTNKLDMATIALISIEPYGSYNTSPSSTRLLSCVLASDPFKDSLYGNLTVKAADAMGGVGENIVAKSANSWFTITTPTGSSATCLRGLWFSYENGSPSLPSGLGLPASFPWIYEGWVVDTSNSSNPIYYSMGRFYDPYHADLDLGGPCSGPNQGFDAPGQDWVQDNCPQGKPSILDLHNGPYKVIITLEPTREMPGTVAYNSPFPLTIYRGPFMPSGCNQQAMLLSVWYLGSPRAHVKII